MMEALRKHMKKIMWLIALMFIGGIFFWYGHGSKVRDFVAEVNNTKIDINDYNQRVTRQLRRTREQAETELTDAQIIQIRRQILSALITQEVLFQEARRLGIIVTDEEVINTIHNLPQFQQDGKFNFNLYIQTLRYSFGSSPDKFEEILRKDIATRRLERFIITSARVTAPELQIQYLNKKGSMANFNEESEELRNDLLQNKRTAIYTNWLNTLQQNSKIKVNIELAGLKTN